MKNKISKILLIGGTIVFYTVFFKNLMGLNALLFSLFVIGSTAYLFPENFKRLQALAAAAAVLFSAGVVLWHSSAMAIFVWVSSLILFIPMVQYAKMRSVHWAGITAFIDYITVFDHLKIEKTQTKSRKKNRSFRIIQSLKLAIIPIIVLIIFFALFKEANPVFDELSTNFFEAINDFIKEYFGNISFLDFLFLLWGFITLSWMLLKKRKDYIAAKEQDFDETISRKRKVKKQTINYIAKGNLKPKLKNEYRVGMMLMIMVNALLLIVNIIDIDWVWLNFEYEGEINLTQFVHEGTYLLILSILISMGIILYFFRKNLNFYHKKKNLQITAYIWIVQNAVLAVSVALRNMHYINEYGLAYKRIGVFFFLCLVIIGLISLIIKITNKKSFFYLMKVNSWAVWIGFLLFAVPDWDIIIAKHNISDEVKQETDLKFLMQLDEKAFPVIDKNMPNLENKSSDTYFHRFGYTTFEKAFYAKVHEFLEEYQDRNFAEFNFADKKSYEYFRDKYGKELPQKHDNKNDSAKNNINR
jgi:hypothetical protein